MPLTPTTALEATIDAAIDAAFTAEAAAIESDAANADGAAMMKTMVKDAVVAAINHIIANGLITTTVAPGIAVTTPVGPGATAAPGSGTGTIA